MSVIGSSHYRTRASGIGQAGYLANRWIAPLFSKRWARGLCGERYCTHSTTSVPVGKRGGMQGAFTRGAAQRLRKKETLSPFGLRVSG